LLDYTGQQALKFTAIGCLAGFENRFSPGMMNRIQMLLGFRFISTYEDDLSSRAG
jgi:hypothetical protein